MCGISGISGSSNGVRLEELINYALQHRGQEGGGIVLASEGHLYCERILTEAINLDASSLLKRHGELTAGHVRYPTVGEPKLENVQPIMIDCKHGRLAICHNGQFTNARELRTILEAKGSVFQGTSDTQVFLNLCAASEAETLDEAVIETALKVQGAFSIILMTPHRLFAICDPHGFRPLSIARLGEAYVFASETCAFDLIGADYWRDVEPGEIVIIENGKARSIKPFPAAPLAHCIFEHVYFARPDSDVFGQSVDEVRTRLGMHLAREHPVDADLIVPVPDSGNCAAFGFHEESGIRLRMGLIRNHYVGRSFIKRLQSAREFAVKVKLNSVRRLLRGKRVVLVDDSLVRGTTSQKIVRMVREAGASEVHVRISCPPVISPCYFGVDTPSRSELIAATHTLEETRAFIGADSLQYLSLEGLRKAIGENPDDYCTGCYTGKYPVPIPSNAIPLRVV